MKIFCKYTSLFAVIFILNGCTSFFALGETQTFKEKYGKNYKNCGVNASPITLIKNHGKYKDTAYSNCIEDSQLENPWYCLGMCDKEFGKKENRK